MELEVDEESWNQIYTAVQYLTSNDECKPFENFLDLRAQSTEQVLFEICLLHFPF